MTDTRNVRSKSEDPATPSRESVTPTSAHHSSFLSMNERAVEDMTLNFFYKPHTITALFGSIFAAMYFAFIRQVSIDLVSIFMLNHHCFSLVFCCIILGVLSFSTVL